MIPMYLNILLSDDNKISGSISHNTSRVIAVMEINHTFHRYCYGDHE